MANQKMGVIRKCDCGACQERPRSLEAREHQRVNRMMSTLDEKNARRIAGLLASRSGHGGGALIARITGMSAQTIHRGIGELDRPDTVPVERVRAVGGGRSRLEKKLPS